jgi:hypothetical protein
MAPRQFRCTFDMNNNLFKGVRYFKSIFGAQKLTDSSKSPELERNSKQTQYARRPFGPQSFRPF